jgi:dTDP-glucose pyrophosphorylase
MEQLEKYKIINGATIRDAIKKMDEGGLGFAVCVNKDDQVMGVLSDGDFRRSVLDGINLNESIQKIINRNFKFVDKDYTKREIKELFSTKIGRSIPVIQEGKLLDIIIKDNFFGIKKTDILPTLDNQVIIMAGGKGTRLDPFTKILPKPLIPIGEDPVIKVIMDAFFKYGMKNFTIAINDKGKMIQAYFHYNNFDYDINFLEEKEFLGTAGALGLLKDKIEKPFFVSNCDVVIHASYSSIMEFHLQGSFQMTLVGSMRRYNVPYGVCEIENGGELKEIREKPHLDFIVNTGLYLLNPSVLQLIPEGKFDMTELMKKMKEYGQSVGVYPVSESAWFDVGQWEDFHKTNEVLG